MYTETISLSSIDAVKKFVCIANEYDFTINLLSDKYKIDAKSIMSVFSLDLSKPITVEIEEECPEKLKRKFRNLSFDSFPAVQIDFFPARRLSKH